MERRRRMRACRDCLQKCRRRAGMHQLVANRIAQEIVHQARLAKAHLRLGRMHVDIDLFGRHFQKQQDDRKRGRRNDVAISLDHRVNDQPVAHQAAVDEEIDRVAVELLQLRLGDKSAHPQKARLRRLIVLRRASMAEARVARRAPFAARRQEEQVAAACRSRISDKSAPPVS